MSLRDRRRILDWEAKWDRPTGLVTFAAVVLILLSSIIVISSINGDNQRELLQKVHEHESTVISSGILNALGFFLLAAPLYFLFRAISSRSDRVRRQLVGLVIVAPLFVGISGLLSGFANTETAKEFLAGNSHPTITREKAVEECKSEAEDKGAKDFAEKYDEGSSPRANCINEELSDSSAKNAETEASLHSANIGFQLAGRLGLAAALLYTCLYGMRLGLLTRFWGSLGMALGVAALLLFLQFVVIFFVYFALLLIRKLPGGRPPAWAAGEAIPWETPGQRVAAELEGEEGGGGGGSGEAIDTHAEDAPVQAPEPEEAGGGTDGAGNGAGDGPPKRKRKRRGS